MTQQELAERAKLSTEAISTLERGARTRPHQDTVALLARALKLSPEQVALLQDAVGIAPPGRHRERQATPKASVVRLVRPEPQEETAHNLPRQLTSFIGSGVLYALQHLAASSVLARRTAQRTDRSSSAARLYGFAEARRAALALPDFQYHLPKVYDRALELLREALGSVEVDRLMAAGAALTEEEAGDEARVLM